MPVVPHLSLNVIDDESGLVPGCPELTKMDRRTFSLVGPELFLFAPYVVADHGVGRIQHVLGGAVILFEANDQRIRINLFKIQNIAYIGAPEAVNGLVVIADDAQVPVLIRQKPHQLELRIVGVLILVHHDIAETVLIRCEHLVMGMKQLHGQHEQIIEIHGVILAEPLLILVIGVRNALVLIAQSRVLLAVVQRRQKLILGRGDLRQNSALPQVLRVDLQVFADFLHQGSLVVRIVDRERRLISQKFNVPAKDPDTHGVKGRDPDALRAEADHPVHPLPHLSRRFIGESDRKNIPWIHAALVHQICDPVRDHSGLAAAGTGQDQYRSLCVPHSLPLLLIQSVINRHI